MLYESLYHIYYKAPERWERAYRERFFGIAARKFPLMLRQYGRAGVHQAFFCYTEEMALLQERILADFQAFTQLEGRMPETAMDIYLRGSLIEEIKSTNDIEGVRSTRKEIMAAMELPAGQRHKKRLGSLVEQYEGIIRGERLQLMSCEDLRRIYDDFLAEEIRRDDPHNLPDGKFFRRGSVDVVSAAQKVVHRGIYPEEKIIAYMEKALAILNDGMIPVFIRVAVFHYLFGYIHPFYDGNGRLSRFITACYLGQYLHPAVALGLSAFIKERQRRYYELFSLTEADINRGELTPFIMGMLELTAEAMKKTTASLQEKMTVYEKNLPYLEKLSLRQKTTQNLCDLLLQAAIFSPHGITVKEMQKYLGKTENTVYAHLKKIPAEMLLVDDRGKNYLYRLQLN